MATTELGKAVKTVSGINPNLKQLVEQILANLGENESKGDDNKNGDDNVNAKDKSNNKRKKGEDEVDKALPIFLARCKHSLIMNLVISLSSN